MTKWISTKLSLKILHIDDQSEVKESLKPSSAPYLIFLEFQAMKYLIKKHWFKKWDSR